MALIQKCKILKTRRLHPHYLRFPCDRCSSCDRKDPRYVLCLHTITTYNPGQTSLFYAYVYAFVTVMSCEETKDLSINTSRNKNIISTSNAHASYTLMLKLIIISLEFLMNLCLMSLVKNSPRIPNRIFF